MRILIVGSGRQAVAAGYDLVRFQPATNLTLCDASLEQAQRAAARLRSLAPESHIEAREVSAASVQEVAALSSTCDAVLAGVPYHLNPLVHLAAGSAGVPSVDMGSDLPELEAALGPKDAYGSSVAVFDSGLAPGLGNQLAAMLIQEGEKVESVKILCGGLPLEPRTPMKYKPRFSLEGLVGEYTDPAIALQNGGLVELESLDGLETVEIPGLGTFEAFVTSGGSSIGPRLHFQRVRNYEYKTLRFPGHCESMRSYRDRGEWRPENFERFAREFEAATSEEDERDQVILAVEATGQTARRVVVHAAFDAQTGLSAMEQLTGFSASIVLQHVLAKPPSPGLYAAEEVVGGRTMLDELEKRGIRPQSSQLPRRVPRPARSRKSALSAWTPHTKGS
jgi:lysine 6-dehydrogenase